MAKAKGFHCRTRSLHSAKKKGAMNITRSLAQLSVGDKVIIKANPFYTKGLPHKSFQGRVGEVYDVRVHTVGVKVTKQLGGVLKTKLLQILPDHLVKVAEKEEALTHKAKVEDAIREVLHRTDLPQEEKELRAYDLVKDSVPRRYRPETIDEKDYEVVQLQKKFKKDKYLRKCDLNKLVVK